MVFFSVYMALQLTLLGLYYLRLKRSGEDGNAIVIICIIFFSAIVVSFLKLLGYL